MALKIDITDEKGVKTRYHKIKSFTYENERIRVNLTSYVNQATRDAEKATLETNRLAKQYDATTEELRAELDNLSRQLAPNGDGDAEVIAKIKELSTQVNDRVLTADRPVYTEPIDKSYDENEVELDYFEPLTIEGIYAKLAVDSRYTGAEAI